jgi:hypothetical protein
MRRKVTQVLIIQFRTRSNSGFQAVTFPQVESAHHAKHGFVAHFCTAPGASSHSCTHADIVEQIRDAIVDAGRLWLGNQQRPTTPWALDPLASKVILHRQLLSALTGDLDRHKLPVLLNKTRWDWTAKAHWISWMLPKILGHKNLGHGALPGCIRGDRRWLARRSANPIGSSSEVQHRSEEFN